MAEIRLDDLGRRLWVFLNEPFVLFILSSVIVSLVAFVYGNWRDTRHAHELQRKYDAEIASRLLEADEFIVELETEISGKKRENDPKYIYVKVRKFLDGKLYETKDDVKPLESVSFEETNPGFRPIVFELLARETDSNEIRKLQNVLAKYEELKQTEKRAADTSCKEDPAYCSREEPGAVSYVRGILNSLIELRSQWKIG